MQRLYFIEVIQFLFLLLLMKVNTRFLKVDTRFHAVHVGLRFPIIVSVYAFHTATESGKL